ncbi:MAG: hypothetical protein LUQ28_07295 [Methylococcaceae bacterium]|nr:hypothetical protein [Methylococcaceae bacterium]
MWWVLNKKNKQVTEGINVNQFMVEIARGNVAGAEPFAAYGRYVATGATTNHIIWPDGDYNIPPPTGVQMSIVSTSANDDGSPVGTGIRTMDIHYLDDTLTPQVENITLNGLTPVLTVATNIRFIQCMHMLTVGSLKTAAGVVTASNSAIVYSQIDAGSRRCAASARMVPKGKKLFVAGAVGSSVSGTAAASSQIKISASYFDGHDLTSQGVYMPFGSIGVQDNAVPYTFPLPAGPFPAGTIVLMEVTVDKAATITGDWFGWLEDA